MKEPVGLTRPNGKRPDGLTLVPWQFGKNLVWDVTVADTVANSYFTSASITAGNAADLDASRKEDKLRRYGYCTHLRTSGFREPWSHLLESTCVFKGTRS